MGIICDYFRAADAEYAVLAVLSGPLSAGFDTVEAKGIDPVVMLGQLVKFIRGAQRSPDTVATRPVGPPPKTEPIGKDAYDRLPENSPWRTGPWLFELNLVLRDTLALVNDARLPELASQWATIEEFRRFVNGDSLLPLVKELVGLARRAQRSGELLYCWTSL